MKDFKKYIETDSEIIKHRFINALISVGFCSIVIVYVFLIGWWLFIPYFILTPLPLYVFYKQESRWSDDWEDVWIKGMEIVFTAHLVSVMCNIIKKRDAAFKKKQCEERFKKK